MNPKTLAVVGIVAYALEVLASASDAGGNSLAPLVLVLFSAAATLVFMGLAFVTLWRLHYRFTAIALVATTALTLAVFWQTVEDSTVNLVINVLRVTATLVYFYVVFLLFAVAKHVPTTAEPSR